MTALTSYPNDPGAKTGGASLQAAIAMREKAPTIRDQVLESIKNYGPSTASEIAKRFNEREPLRALGTVRPRLTELYMSEELRKLDATREGLFGKQEHYYALAKADA